MSWSHVEALTVAALQAALRSRKRLPPIPEAGRPAWAAFEALNSTRAWADGHPAPITFAEIEAWTRLQPLPPHPQTIEIVRAMDRAFRTWAAERRAK